MYDDFENIIMNLERWHNTRDGVCLDEICLMLTDNQLLIILQALRAASVAQQSFYDLQYYVLLHKELDDKRTELRRQCEREQ